MEILSGHLDNEIDFAGSQGLDGMEADHIKLSCTFPPECVRVDSDAKTSVGESVDLDDEVANCTFHSYLFSNTLKA